MQEWMQPLQLSAICVCRPFATNLAIQVPVRVFHSLAGIQFMSMASQTRVSHPPCCSPVDSHALTKCLNCTAVNPTLDVKFKVLDPIAKSVNFAKSAKSVNFELTEIYLLKFVQLFLRLSDYFYLNKDVKVTFMYCALFTKFHNLFKQSN